MRFRPTALSNALVIHDDDVADLLLAIDELDLLGRRWWLTIEIVRVVQVTCPHLPDKVLCLRIGEVVVLVNLRVNASKLVCVSHPDLLISRAAMVHNCWFVGFGLCQVPLITYNWSAGHGGCLRDRRSHPAAPIHGCYQNAGLPGQSSPKTSG